MATQHAPHTAKAPPPERSHRVKIRNRLITIATLLALITVLVYFLLNFSGFNDWERIDTNLTIFAAVIVNIVILTTVFYMLLRNLFKLVSERKKPFSGVKLKTKLIVAFVALSLPSIAYHLFASGVTAVLLENLSRAEFRQILNNSRVVLKGITDLQDAQMRQRAREILSYLPKERPAYAREDWLNGYVPRFSGGIFIYDRDNQVAAQWVSDEKVLGSWKYPPPQKFTAKKGASWREHFEHIQVRRFLMPVPDSQMKVEVFEIGTLEMTRAVGVLAAEQDHSRFLNRDLATLILTFLVVMTLLIIFAATWIAFYLARGFVQPLESLDDATHRVAGGELGFQVDQSTLGPMEADFEGLVTSFNTMSRQLKEQNLQLVTTTEDLRNSHHQLGERNRVVELLLENIDAGIVSLNQQGNLTALNRTAKRLLQPRLESWQGRHYSVVLGRDLVKILDEMLEQLRVQPDRELSRNLTLSANRKPVIAEMTLLALDNKDGEAEGTVVMLKDVSAMQRNQRAMAWREVARRVAHEIKNPLTPIQLSAQRIRRKYLDALDGDGEILDQCTATIIGEVASLKKMVNEFSEFAKLPESKPVTGDLNAIIEEVSRFYENGLPENIRLLLKLERGLPSFPLDREQMKRVFTNLIENAASSMDNGGAITIGTKFDEEIQAINVEVMDEGAGVPEHIRSRMFEPYASTKAGGTGLGLTIVNQIVSDHNGFIRYSDRKPKGAIFSLEFRLQ
ncbi:MAG: PAS domain-containing protein [SAR324 cluster bacterium]|nr:PAS domain-containing protein [SAR324 cluster bacterium]